MKKIIVIVLSSFAFLLSAQPANAAWFRRPLLRQRITKTTVFDQRKNLLLGITQKIITYLGKIGNKGEVEKEVVYIKKQQTKIKNAQNLQELQEITQDLKNFWQELRLKAKKIIAKNLLKKTEKNLEKLEDLSWKINQDLPAARLPAGQGRQEKLISFDEKLFQAQEEYQELNKEYEKVETQEQAKSLLQKIFNFVRQNGSSLRQAVKELRKVSR